MTTNPDKLTPAAISRCVAHWAERKRATADDAEALLSAIEMAYAEGLKAAIPPGDHVLDDTGAVRRVIFSLLGTLPITADGCVAVPMAAIVYHPSHPRRLLEVEVDGGIAYGFLVTFTSDGSKIRRSYPIGNCYSTEEAAESARQEEPQQ